MSACRHCGVETPTPCVLRVTIVNVYRHTEEEDSSTVTLRLCDVCAGAARVAIRHILFDSDVKAPTAPMSPSGVGKKKGA